jgi:hypothetical protein
MGHWCGYVGIPEDHPFFGHGYHEYDEVLHVHGGITYSADCDDDPVKGICHVGDDKRFWIGFDCCHAGDMSPGHLARLRQFNIDPTGGLFDGVYRDFNYVKHECEQLAKQLKEAQDAATAT